MRVRIVNTVISVIFLFRGIHLAICGLGSVQLYKNSEVNIKFSACRLDNSVFVGGYCTFCLEEETFETSKSFCPPLMSVNKKQEGCNESSTKSPYFLSKEANIENPDTCSTSSNDEKYVCCTKNDEDFHKLKLWKGVTTLRRKVLQVVTIERPPFVKKMGKRGFAGVIYEFLYALRDKYNLRINVRLPPDGNWGAITPNKTWNGMIGMVISKEADIGAAGFSITLERARVVDFTWAFHQEPTAILIPPPTEGEKLTVLIRPLSKQVWAALLVTVFVLVPSFYALHVGHEKLVSRSFSNFNTSKMFGDLSWFILGTILQQGLGSPVEKTRFLSIIWLFMVVVLANVYLGYLVSYLSAPKLYNVVDSLEDLSHQRKLKWTFRSNTAHFSLFKSASSTGVYRTIGDRSPISDLVMNDSDGVAQVLNNNKAFLKEKSYLDVALSKDFEVARKCRLTLAKKTFFTVGIALAVGKGNPILEVLDTELSNTIATGVMEKWKQLHWPKNLWCADAVSYIISTQPKTRKLRLTDLQTAYFLFGTGIAFSMVSFLSEYLVNKSSRSWRTLVLKRKIQSVWKFTR